MVLDKKVAEQTVDFLTQINAIKLNNDIRSSYNKETDREFEQNTRFRGDD